MCRAQVESEKHRIAKTGTLRYTKSGVKVVVETVTELNAFCLSVVFLIHSMVR